MAMNPFNNYGQDYIASLNNSYRDAKVTSRGGTTLPEGSYQAFIHYVSLSPSKLYADELQLAIGMEVIAGDQKGARCTKFYAIVPERIGILKSDLNTLNIDIGDDITLLGEQETIDQILDQIVDITVKHKIHNGKNYQNIYINRSAGKADNFVEADDDDNPFDT